MLTNIPHHIVSQLHIEEDKKKYCPVGEERTSTISDVLKCKAHLQSWVWSTWNFHFSRFRFEFRLWLQNV